MNALIFLATLVLSSNVLVLRSGEKIVTAGDAKETSGRIVFHAANGGLFSIPLEEIDLAATANPPASAATPDQPRTEAAGNDSKIALKVSEAERKRLIAELEENHLGSPPPEAHFERVPSPPPQNTDAEWSWRHRAQQYEEAVRQAKENLELLQERAEALRARIDGFFALGYKPSQFTYDSTQLQAALEQIPYAELEVTRAERAYDEFRDEARRRDITPGWLR